MGKLYPVGLVGEEHYAANVAQCRVGQDVVLLREPGNPFDNGAIVVKNQNGNTVGYIAKKNFVYEHVNTAGGGALATIKAIQVGGNGSMQIVLDVELDDEPLDFVDFIPVESEEVAVDRVGPMLKGGIIAIVVIFLLVKCSGV
jgi:hypothetical protein